MKRAFFVTGTDTEVGKTLISAALVHALAHSGLKAAGMKPVAAGCTRVGGRLLSGDTERLSAAGNVILAPEIANPYAFEAPLAPHIAARQAGEHIALAPIKAAFEAALREVDVLIVEGVGGFRVPLNENEDSADLAVMLGLPLILVVGMRLGCLNHALLTAEAIATRGLTLAGWVANNLDSDMLAQEDNFATLSELLPAPCLGMVPRLRRVDFDLVSACLEVKLLR